MSANAGNLDRKDFMGNSQCNQKKIRIKTEHLCPICKKKITIAIEKKVLDCLKSSTLLPFAHIYLHGRPCHALLIYIDKNLAVRGMKGINSVQVERNLDTFSGFLSSWSFPY